MSEQIVESQISRVTVYRSGAYVTRVATLAGLEQERLRLVGLPLSLEDTTVSCRILASHADVDTDEASGDEATRDAPVAAGFKVALDAPGPQMQSLRAEAQELKELRLHLKQLRARSRFLHEGLAHRVKLGERAASEKGHAPIASPLEARLALLDFDQEHHRSLYDEHQVVQSQLELAQRRLEELEADEQRASSVGQAGQDKLCKCVVVRVQGSAPGKETGVELSYFVPGACWAPAYGLRIREDLRSAELTMRAMVSQRSGEDWSDVQLTLSTAELQRWAEVPELKSKRIGRRQEQAPKRGWRPPPPGAEELYRDYDNSFASQPVPPVAGAVADAVLLSQSASATAMDYRDKEAEEEFDLPCKQEHAAEVQEAKLSPVSAAMPPGRAGAALSGSRKKSRSSRRKQKSLAAPPAEMWQDEDADGWPGLAARYDGDEFGGGPESGPESGPEARVDDALLNYASLRMSAASSSHRGSLRLSSLTRVYSEYLIEQGLTVDEEFCELLVMQVEQAHERAQDIAAVPTDHSLAWAEGYDYAYRAQDSLDLLSDGQFHSVPVMASDTECSCQHVVVPRESTDVFRTLELSNCFGAPLLPGPMDVYWNENFLLTSQVSLTAPKGRVELGLGVDQAVKVVRNTHYREDTAGLMGGALQLTHKIAIEIANHSSRDIKLQVRERVPVPASDADDIKVEIKSVSPQWQSYEPKPDSANMDALQGGYQWQVAMPPGERRELSASYEIRLPSKFELRAGNRREW